MARTPLLRWIQRLATEHAAAERLGVTPAEFRHKRARAALSRREFLKTGGAFGAVAAAAGPAALMRPARAAASARIAIIGAGIAGLNAALTLQDKGLASTAYEASDRIGAGDFPHPDRQLSGGASIAKTLRSCA